MNTYIKEAKQVLVWQSQLRNVRGEQVRKGKIAAQLAHASLKAILDTAMYLKSEKELTIYYGENPALEEWLTGRFTKVALKCESESELLELYQKAQEKKIICSLITDAGLTEFEGPTITCIAIGPAWPEEIDPITGHLSTL